MGAKLTQGAIRAAEIVTGGKYGSNYRYATEYGGKTVEGIAAIIDDQTAAPDLLEACKALLGEMWSGRKRRNVKKDFHLMVAEEAARTAIAKATGVKP